MITFFMLTSYARVNVLKESFLKPFWSLDITQVGFNTRSNWEEKLYFPSRISWVFGDLRVAFLIISFSSKMYFHPSFFSSRSHSLQFSIDQCRMNISQRYLQVLWLISNYRAAILTLVYSPLELSSICHVQCSYLADGPILIHTFVNFCR